MPSLESYVPWKVIFQQVHPRQQLRQPLHQREQFFKGLQMEYLLNLALFPTRNFTKNCQRNLLRLLLLWWCRRKKTSKSTWCQLSPNTLRRKVSDKTSSWTLLVISNTIWRFSASTPLITLYSGFRWGRPTAKENRQSRQWFGLLWQYVQQFRKW